MEIVKRTLAQKLLEFQNNIEVIKKDGKNEFFKKANGKASSYATLPNILSEVKPILNALKILVTQPIINNEVLTVLIDTESGDQVQSGVLIPNGLSAQQAGSAITYFRRYTLSSLLALEIDEDDDGNLASKKADPKPAAKPAKKIALIDGTEPFNKAVAWLKAGKGTIDQIEENHLLTTEAREALLTKST